MANVDASGTRAEDMLRRIAYHEAGHVVVAIVLGHEVEQVVVDPGNPTGAKEGEDPNHFVTWTDGVLSEDITRPLAENRAIFAFAGDAAEMCLIGGRPAGEFFQHGPDYGCAFSGAARIFPENRERHAFLDEMEDRARAFVRDPVRWRQIRAVAEALLERHKLTGAEAAALMAHVGEDGCSLTT
jgi:hypothetical protein